MPLEYLGRESVTRFRRRGERDLHTLQVFTVAEGRIARNVVFADPGMLSMFGVPERIRSE